MRLFADRSERFPPLPRRVGMSPAQSGAAAASAGDSTTDDVSAAELATCISVLRRLGSAVDAYPELDALGKDTWRRAVLKERYGAEDAAALSPNPTPNPHPNPRPNPSPDLNQARRTSWPSSSAPPSTRSC